MIFLESLDVVFSVSLALLSAHRDGLLLCTSCEEAAEYLKHKLPDIDNNIYDKVMKKVGDVTPADFCRSSDDVVVHIVRHVWCAQVASLDISRQLSEYAVEYAVLSEEMPRLAALGAHNQRLAADNQRMAGELDVSTHN